MKQHVGHISSNHAMKVILTPFSGYRYSDTSFQREKEIQWNVDLWQSEESLRVKTVKWKSWLEAKRFEDEYRENEGNVQL